MKENIDKVNLKEDINHGTVMFPLANYSWNEHGKFIVKLHWHDEMEIVFFKKGKFTVHINMEQININEPAFVFIAPGDIHSIIGENGCMENAIVFDLKMLSFEYFDGVQYEIIRPLIEKKICMPRVIFKDDAIWNSIEKIYKDIVRDLKTKNLSSFIKIKAHLYEMIAVFYENRRFKYLDNRSLDNNYKISNIKKVLTYIHEKYYEKIYNEDLSKIIGMNSQYFCRYFKKLLGKTPTEYINEVRIEKAKELLLETNNKIIDIAIWCGYDNIGYFIKKFKEQNQVTPKEYRKIKMSK